MQAKWSICSRRFSKRESETPGQPGVRGVKMPGGVPQPVPVEGGGGGILSEEAIIVGKIKVTADVRTNRIHVVTRPINMPFIRKLIGEFDANVEFAKPVTRHCNTFLPATFCRSLCRH